MILDQAPVELLDGGYPDRLSRSWCARRGGELSALLNVNRAPLTLRVGEGGRVEDVAIGERCSGSEEVPGVTCIDPIHFGLLFAPPKVARPASALASSTVRHRPRQSLGVASGSPAEADARRDDGTGQADRQPEPCVGLVVAQDDLARASRDRDGLVAAVRLRQHSRLAVDRRTPAERSNGAGSAELRAATARRSERTPVGRPGNGPWRPGARGRARARRDRPDLATRWVGKAPRRARRRRSTAARFERAGDVDQLERLVAERLYREDEAHATLAQPLSVPGAPHISPSVESERSRKRTRWHRSPWSALPGPCSRRREAFAAHDCRPHAGPDADAGNGRAVRSASPGSRR